MASKQETTLLFKVAMFLLVFAFIIIVVAFFGPNKAGKSIQVAKSVTTAKVVERKGVIPSRVVRDVGDTENSNSNGAVNMKLDLGGMSFDLKNSK